jgi:hypothetical protein
MSKKTLIAVSTALALGVLGSVSAFASDRDEDGNSASQATIDLREWHQGIRQGQAVTNDANAYGFATQQPHRTRH